MTQVSRDSLRRQMRRHRRALTPDQQRRAAAQLARQLQQTLWFRRARHLGLYLPMGGELDALPAVSRDWPTGRQLYLPVVRSRPAPSMRMSPWHPDEQLLTNTFGIGEPLAPPGLGRPLWALDLLLIPLVAFDREGNRLGMGGGYYDRLLATLAQRPRRPRLVGLGYSFQEVDTLPHASWDIPLDMIATEREVIDCRTGRAAG